MPPPADNRRDRLARVMTDANAAGNRALAQRAAQAIRALDAGTSIENAPTAEQAAIHDVMRQTTGPLQRYVGEPALALATGAIGSLAGLFKSVPEYTGINDPSDATPEQRAASALDSMRELTTRMTYVPRSAEGQQVVETIGATMAPVMEWLDERLQGTLKLDPYQAEWVKAGFGAITGGRLNRVPNPRRAAVAGAQESGYRIIPSEAEAAASVGRRAAEGIGGRDNVVHWVQQFNDVQLQRNTGQALGLPEGKFPNEANLRTHIADIEARGYVPLRQSQLPVDIGTQKFYDALQRIDEPRHGAAPVVARPKDAAIEDLKRTWEQPNSARPDVNSLLDELQSLRRESQRNLNGNTPEIRRFGEAQRNLTNALEDAIEDATFRSGQPELYQNFVTARRDLAITNRVLESLDDAGHVSAKKLLDNLRDSGVPRDRWPEQFRRLDDAYSAFRTSFQRPSRSLEGRSPVSLFSIFLGAPFGAMAGGMLGLGSGNALLGSAVGGFAALVGTKKLAELIARRPLSTTRVSRPGIATGRGTAGIAAAEAGDEANGQQ